jgi:hypothetical protein
MLTYLATSLRKTIMTKGRTNGDPDGARRNWLPSPPGYVDAEAIAEAVQGPTMRFVPIKTEDSLTCKPFIACGTV